MSQNRTYTLRLCDDRGKVIETWDVRRVDENEWDRPDFAPPSIAIGLKPSDMTGDLQDLGDDLIAAIATDESNRREFQAMLDAAAKRLP